MKKLGVFLISLFMTAAVPAQDKGSLSSRLAQKGILNHMDVGVNVGTLGIGIDVAVPVGNYVRLRAGYNYMPRFTIHSDFSIETNNGGSLTRYFDRVKNIDIEKKMTDMGIDPEAEGVQEYVKMANEFRNLEPKDQVTMNLRPSLHQFKFLVDVMPFKNNKHWSFTTGFFAGPSQVGDASNQDGETLLLKAVNTYNEIYVKYCQEGINGNYHEKLDEIFYNNGIVGIPLGYFADGKKAMMVPGKDNTVRAEMSVSKVRPYVGFGYNTYLSHNKKWNLNVDAGVLFLCGKPKVYIDNVYKIDAGPLKGYFNEDGEYQYESGIGINEDGTYYGDIVRPNGEFDYDNPEDPNNPMFIVDEPLQHVDIMRDLDEIPGKVGDMVKTISKFKVYPNLSVTVSYRLY